MLNQSSSNAIVVAIVIGIVAVGAGTGIFAGMFMTQATVGHANGSATTQTESTTPYNLIMVITTNNVYNNTVGDQPAFFVLSNGTLMSSANISIPANRQIDLTIINYDNGNGTLSSIFANVTGTLNGKETILNNTNVNSTNGGNQIAVNGSAEVSSVNVSMVSHTFTVFANGKEVLNIPVVESSIVQASFVLSPGTYTWQCEVSCGSGSSGWDGAMNTVGWMTGTLTAQ
ncbi:MAG: hypothetical protein M1424_01575 [Candidatus Thermoplasmatota archaeon]|jgi:hypothetical protein|nr:hypothetical protein [Candidatus Thermoplasmatota archaeon]